MIAEMKPAMRKQAPQKATCPNCNGATKVTRIEPKWWGGSKSGVALIGHPVTKAYVCTTCAGTGKVAA